MKNKIDYDRLLLKEFKYWDLYLHENQSYLGRTFLLLKDKKMQGDFLDIKKAAQDEFFLIGTQVKNALNTLFQPDKMNYAALSNTSPIIHVHLIPRYQTDREFYGTVFKDERWGKNYAPYDKSFSIDESLILKIRDTIKHSL